MSGLRRLLVALIALLALAVVAGFAWIALAAPPQWEVRAGSTVMTERESAGQIGVEVVYGGLGVVLSFVWAGLVGFWARRQGWLLVPYVALAGLAAAGVTWWVGVHAGPQIPQDRAVGDHFDARLEIIAPASFAVWAVAALLGLLLATWFTERRGHLSVASGSEQPAPRP